MYSKTLTTTWDDDRRHRKRSWIIASRKRPPKPQVVMPLADDDWVVSCRGFVRNAILLLLPGHLGDANIAPLGIVVRHHPAAPRSHLPQLVVGGLSVAVAIVPLAVPRATRYSHQ